MMEDDYDFSVCAIHYLRVLVSAELCSIQNGKARLNETGRELQGEWSTLPARYKQLTLDAGNVMPIFIHGILVIDQCRQKILEVEHSWSQNVRYSFVDIVNGFQNALRKRRRPRPVGLRGKYYFSEIRDQISLERFRSLIWASPKAWDDGKKSIAGSDWPELQEGLVGKGITAPCPFCNPPVRPRKDKVRICRRHRVVVHVPADPSEPISYTPLMDWLNAVRNKVSEVGESSYDELKAGVAELEKQAGGHRSGELRFKVGEKGGVSVYGLGRFPVTLYYEQWIRVLDASEELHAFLARNRAERRLKLKEQ